jgi:hypothetical protein
MNLVMVRTKSANVLIVRVVDMSLSIAGRTTGRLATGVSEWASPSGERRAPPLVFA